MSAELIVYTDESTTKNHRFQNFYGGALVRSKDLGHVESVLSGLFANLGFTSEVKWVVINQSLKDRYIQVVDTLFDLVEQDKVKIRIMFTETAVKAAGLSREHYVNEYWILYYQFLKHAFGFQYCDEFPDGVRVRLMIDQMPGTKLKRQEFRNHVVNLNNVSPITSSQVYFDRNQIAEVDSKNHVILQALDVVLGSMHFKLNKLDRAKPEGMKRRGARTRAKDDVYRHIQSRLKKLRNHFNIGASTGTDGDRANQWRQSYRHWKFEAKNSERV